MPSLKELKHEYTALALKAHEVVDSGRPVAEIKDELDKIDPDLKSLSERIADAEYLDEKRKSLGGIINGASDDSIDETTEEAITKSFGRAYLETPEFAESVKAIKLGGKIPGFPVELKTTMLESGQGSTSVIAQDRVPGIVPILFERLTVADLMPNTTTNSNTVRSVVESTATNNASSVAEGAAKPQSLLIYNVVDEPVRKIANYIKVSSELLEDLDQVEGEIQGRLALFVKLEEEAQLLNGNGVLPDLTGFLHRSGLTAAQPVGSETYGKDAIAIHKEITKVRVASFLDPDAIVMHPNDWENAAFEADANGQFFGNGPFTGAYGNAQAGNSTYGGTYWGLKVVVTTAMTENTALLGAFRLGASIARRRGITVTMTNSDGTDFVNNIVTILAEERLALRVIRPSAFGTVTGIA